MAPFLGFGWVAFVLTAAQLEEIVDNIGWVGQPEQRIAPVPKNHLIHRQRGRNYLAETVIPLDLEDLDEMETEEIEL